MSSSHLLLETRPSWWNYFWYLLFFWLVIPLLVAIWKRHQVVLRVFGDRIEIERGIFSKNTREIFLSDIRALSINQNFIQRVFGVGDVLIETEGSSDDDDAIHGLPNPMKIESLVHQQRRKIRD
jgi:uncharacterized membrane protein YdbT with pleckstrin-like domain